ncbi:MAG: formyltransferase family protein [Rhabdochlamydiaceae bacterium]|jgi:folate-dependent phosphoribosylglycinamide formyltransferase PurN
MLLRSEPTQKFPLYRPFSHRPMHVAVFGSGSGTILRAMLAAQKKSEEVYGSSPFVIKLLYTDRACRFQQIASQENLPLIEHLFADFFKARGIDDFRDPIARKEYDQKGIELFVKQDTPIDFLLLAGYMRILSTPWLELFSQRILNVHPADLTHLDSNGNRKFTGDHAILKALQDGQKKTRSTVILIDERTDTGPIIVSGPWVTYQGEYPVTKERAAEHQEVQKVQSDWPACLTALQLISQGRVEMVSKPNRLLIDGIEQMPNGYENLSASFTHDQRGLLYCTHLGTAHLSAVVTNNVLNDPLEERQLTDGLL